MKGNTASMIALIVATLVLLVVGGNSYRNYLRAQYEREYGVLEKHRQGGNSGNAANVNSLAANGLADGGNDVASTLDPTPPLATQSPDSSLGSPPAQSVTGLAGQSSSQGVSSIPPAVGQAPPANTSPAVANAPSSSVGTAPATASTAAGTDPEIARLQARLKALEQESALYQKKLNQGSSNQAGTGAASPSAALKARPIQSGSLREVMAGEGKGASTALFPEQGKEAAGTTSTKAEFERQIREAPSAGKVIAFNPEWGFVQIDAGKNRNISSGTKFAVRRGISIVGYVKVTEVSDNMSIAELTSRNEFSETARKPKPGDDVISWPLF